MNETITKSVAPFNNLRVLSQNEVAELMNASSTGAHQIFRQCALAVLNSGSSDDNTESVLDTYKDFDIQLIPQSRGLKLELINAPARAFVDGHIINGIREHLFAVLRDVVYAQLYLKPQLENQSVSGAALTNSVFETLRNAQVLQTDDFPNMVVCWGGHSIAREEYDYTKVVGHELGLRGLNICTGCGPGAMKGPMKGATIGHSKQRKYGGRYLGLTEPSIIAAESPNPLVNELVILPDIEKRLEAFVRVGHGIIVFPGGVGTAEEMLYILGVLSHPDNEAMPFPLILTGPASAKSYFEKIDEFLMATVGPKLCERYTIIVDDPAEVARTMVKGITEVRGYRRAISDAYYFNWKLNITTDFQRPFFPTHNNMRNVVLSGDLPSHELAANLRRAFSGIVSGNVKAESIRAIREHGPFQIQGEARIATLLDELLKSFIAQGRMKIGGQYTPCYEVVG